MNTTPHRDLVLVGGGHAHVQVIRRWMMDPLPEVRLTVIVDRPDAVYSGMVPGRVAGDYEDAELEIDVVPLARRAQARVVLAGATRIVPATKRIELEGRPSLPYDVASLDVGSTVRGLELPGVGAHALATRPIRRFLDRLDARIGELGDAPRIALVGGGAAGVELAFTLDARLRALGRRPVLEVVSEGPDLVPGASSRLRARVLAEFGRRGITHRHGHAVAEVDAAGWSSADGMHEAADLVVWATGAAPTPLLGASPLPTDSRGFVRVDSCFRVEGEEDLFAAGDCAAFIDHPWVPKAGVHAVRAGPVLDANLRARLRDRPLRRHRPQRDFLALLNLGGQRAIGGKWGFAASGPWVWRLKDAIDRRFMERFQVLGAAGEESEVFPTPESMGMDEMACGGCAAKVGASPLSRALHRLEPASPDERVVLGLAEPDDAAAVRTPGGDVVLATVDGFRAFTDDPWWVGRVAAVNAVSDVYAKAGVPRHAMALVTVPDEEAARAEETLFQVLSGVRAALDPLGISLVGGHSTVGPELFVGLSVSGDAQGSCLPIGALAAGDALVLTAPLGTGVLMAADMQGRARGEWLASTLAHMARTNRTAAEIAHRLGAHAATDVSGFGLAGHLGEMLDASRLGARLRLDTLPALPGARELLARGMRSQFHDQNAEGRRGIRWQGVAGDPDAELLFDPQTSGGLLLAFPRERLDEALAALAAAGDEDAAWIGDVTPDPSDGVRLTVEGGA